MHLINIFISALFIILNNTDYHNQNAGGTPSAVVSVLLIVQHSRFGLSLHVFLHRCEENLF